MRVAPYDVDDAPRLASDGGQPGRTRFWRRADKPRLGRVVLDEAQVHRRWRPAVIMGQGAPRFVRSYFHPPPAVPWLGSVWARDATTFGQGTTLVGQRSLIGCGLMRHPSLFPAPEAGVTMTAAPEGDYDISVPPRTIHYAGATCNLNSPGLAIYGHWLLDLLPRLALCRYMKIDVDRYLIGGPRLPWKDALLEMIGAPLDKIVYLDGASQAATCDLMHLPTFCRFDSEVRPELHRLYKPIAARAAAAQPSRRLFVSRAAWGGSRPMSNREEIEKIFETNGFEIIMPEALPLCDVINAFASAAIVVGECGSGLHNAVFCPAGTRVGVIQSEANQNFLFAQLAMAQAHEIWYLIGTLVETKGGAYCVDPATARGFAESIVQ